MAEYFGTTVADIFNTMPKRFKPDEAKDVDIVIGYECQGEGGGKWKAAIKSGTLKVETVEGDLKGCSATINAVDAETFIGVTLPKIAPLDALSSGKLRVIGDTRLLMTLLPKVFVQYTVPEKKKDITARDIIAAMTERFRPEKAEGVDMKIGYDLTGDGGGQWTIVIKDKSCTLREGFAEPLTVKMIMDADVYKGMMVGTIDGTSAFMSGQVKIEGDMMAAGATAKFFSRYVDSGAKETEELISLKVINAIDQRFATGPIMGMWFAGLKQRKFLANVCPVCKRTQIPPREICAICRVRCSEFVEIGPKGTVTNYDIVYFASPDPLTGTVRDTPYVALYLVLDGASEQEAFALELKREDMTRVKVGSRVKPVWARETAGSYRDLLYFELDD